MSQHPSLRSKGKGLKFRSVLKRFEKLRHLVEKEKWTGESSIFSIPKIKMIKFKIKKEKAVPEKAAAGAETAAAAEGQAAKPSVDGKDAKGKQATPKSPKAGEKSPKK